MLRQQAKECEIWYTETDDPNDELKMMIVKSTTTVVDLGCWLSNYHLDHSGTATIRIIREHF